MVLALNIILMITCGIMYSAGVIYVIVADEFKSDRRVTAWLTSIPVACFLLFCMWAYYFLTLLYRTHSRTFMVDTGV